MLQRPSYRAWPCKDGLAWPWLCLLEVPGRWMFFLRDYGKENGHYYVAIGVYSMDEFAAVTVAPCISCSGFNFLPLALL